MLSITITQHLAQHSFVQLPRWLLNQNLSPHAKLLYAFLLDRAKLSELNGHRDEDGTYVFLTMKQAQALLGCSKKRATSAFRELEEQKLLFRKRQGCMLANLYYPTPPELPCDITIPAEESRTALPSLPAYSSIDHDALSCMPPPF